VEPEVGIEPTNYRLQDCQSALSVTSTSNNSHGQHHRDHIVNAARRCFAPYLMPFGLRSAPRTGVRPGDGLILSRSASVAPRPYPLGWRVASPAAGGRPGTASGARGHGPARGAVSASRSRSDPLTRRPTRVTLGATLCVAFGLSYQARVAG
jgi:hypothetical protein